MIIHSAQFVKSSQFPAQCPQGGLPEYAFAGRSNVGKSSLINMLTGVAHLSKVSGIPGKTRLINHFLINNQWYLADLPGYGYAKADKRLRQGLRQMIEGYLRGRAALTLLFALIDVRLPPQRVDLEFVQFLGQEGIPFYMVFTKTDKVSALAAHHTLRLWQSALQPQWEPLPPVLFSSSAKGTGRQEMLEVIERYAVCGG